ncbi:MAG: arsenate reductase (glutaredoxin) [Planctomycetes bacterium]|nr:arsenate reductase (glutaredoxin) [Planctomycetota bacterium]
MSGKVTIYHNPRCTKSRQTLQLIRDAGVEPEIVEYLKSPPTTAELDAILKKLKREPLEAMRRKEAVFNELGLNSDTSREDALIAMAENPILIERPIVVRDRNAVIGRPPENVNDLLD